MSSRAVRVGGAPNYAGKHPGCDGSHKPGKCRSTRQPASIHVLERAAALALQRAKGDILLASPLARQRIRAVRDKFRSAMTPEFLARAIGVPIGPVVEAWAEPLTAAMAEFGISGSLLREACFLATINHESRSLSALRENMNYGAQGLANTWPRFSTTGVRGGPPNDLAFALARKPEKIANHVYANRMGNGIPESGDGWTYRGGGPGMLTGRDNYRHFGQIIGVDLENQPELIETPRVGALAFAAFWRERGCNEAADSGDFDKVSDLVNIGRHTEAFGDSIGWIDRAAKLRLALSAWEGPIE